MRNVMMTMGLILLMDNPPAPCASSPKEKRVEKALPTGAIARLGKAQLRKFDDPEQVQWVNFSLDGKELYSGRGWGARELWKWRVHDWQLSRREPYPHNLIAIFEEKVGVYNESDFLVLRNLADGKRIRKINEQGKWTGGDAFSEGGFAAAFSAERIIFLEMPTGKLIRSKPIKRPWTLSRDGRLLAWIAKDGICHIEDSRTGEKRRSFGGMSTANAIDIDKTFIVFSDDGTQLRKRDFNDPRYYFWDVATGRQVQRIRVAEAKGQLHNLCSSLSSDGRTLATSFEFLVPQGKGEVQLWDVRSGQERQKFVGHLDAVNGLAFSPDSAILASASNDGSILIWDANCPHKKRPDVERLSGEDLRKLWEDLGGHAAKAHDAIWELRHFPDMSVPFVKKHLHPRQPLDDERLKQLIVDVGSESFVVRKKAIDELGTFGEMAWETLNRARAEARAIEVQRRIDQLLEKMLVMPPDRLREIRAIEVLERIGTAQAREILQSLARGAINASLTREAQAALKRLSH